MAIIQAAAESKTVFNVRYSAPFGGLYVSNDANEAAMDGIKAEIGDAAWKKGFTGLKGDTVSARIRNLAKEKGITPIAITGRLTNARVALKDMSDGRQQAYLQVTLTDNESRTFLSVGAGSQGAQMLIRKLVAAELGVETELNLFATFGQNPKSQKWFAEHGASLKQNGAEVKGVDPRISLAPQLTAAEAALKAAGVDDKETLSKRRQKVTYDYHIALMNEVATRCEKWREEQSKSEMHQDHGDGQPEADGHQDAAAGGYDGEEVPVF